MSDRVNEPPRRASPRRVTKDGKNGWAAIPWLGRFLADDAGVIQQPFGNRTEETMSNDHDSLAQPSPFRTVPSSATNTTAPPDDTTIDAIREQWAGDTHWWTNSASVRPTINELLAKLDAVTAERDALRAIVDAARAWNEARAQLTYNTRLDVGTQARLGAATDALIAVLDGVPR